jgi:hypothetical protein
MLRDVSESLFDFLIEAFPSDRAYARSDFEQDPMPPLLAHFLSQTLYHRLDTEVEQLRAVRTKWFDYEAEEVQHAYKQLVVSLAHHARIPEEEWRGTLKRASKVVLAHLILPAHTLVEFVFRDDEKPLVAPVIHKQLSYFAAYPYLREAVETFMSRRNMDQIDRGRFASLLTQIDRHMTAEFVADDWLRLLRPLFDLMNRIPSMRGQGVPIELLSMYFGDKESHDIQGRLQVEREVRRLSSLNEDALRNVLEASVEPYEQPIAATPMGVQVPEAPPSPPTPPAPAPTTAPAPPVPESGPKPLWQQFQRAPTANGGSPPPPAAAPHRPAPAANEAPPAAPVPLWRRFQQPGDKPAGGHTTAPPAPPLDARLASPPPPPAFVPTLQDLAQLERKILGPQGLANRSLFIEHLFGGSSADYAQTLNELRHLPDWAQASQFIADRVFKRHHVNIWSPAALLFTESVEGQYREAR